jgi:hypothetical protein
MRQDKEAVQAYKMNIKSHLLRLGLIRGQPRTALNTGSSVQASNLVGTPSTGPNSSRAGSERGSFQLPFDDPQQHVEFTFSSGMPSSISGKNDSLICIPSRISSSMTLPGNAPFPSPSAASPSYSDTWVSSDLYGMTHILRPSASPGLPGTVEPSTLPPENFSNVPGAGGNFQWAMQPTGLTDQDTAVKREHLAYYFNHVRGLQFLFTCKVALDAIQSVSTDPNVNLYV